MGSIVGFSVSLPSIRSHSRAKVSARWMQYCYSPFLSVGRSRHRLVCLSKRTLALTPRMDVTAQGTAEPSQKQFESLPARTLVCTSLTSSTVDGQLAEMRAAKAAGADLAELRVDLLADDERPSWLRALTDRVLPVIVTNRASWEGGNAPVGEPSRLTVLADAAKSGAEFIDVELAAFPEFKRLFGVAAIPARTKLILSHHNFDKPLSSDECAKVYRRMVDEDADVCKIAMAAKSASDNATAFEALMQARDRPLIMLLMGELGQCSRILAPKYGSYLTFACVGAGRESAPGQVATETLIDMYRFHSITEKTSVFGVIGNPVSHSMSPALHNAAFASAGIDGVYVPLKVDDDVAAFIRTMTIFGFAGFSVTIPGKVAALEAMDGVEDVTRKIGAMNTVVTGEEGELLGHNTDWVAAISAIEDGLEECGKTLNDARVLCIGAGGAARGLAYGALARGAGHVVIVNRTARKAEELAKDIGNGASAELLESLSQSSGSGYDVVMNTTAVGMHPSVDESPIPDGVAGLHRLGKPLVFDAVYNPLETKLLREAKDAGFVCVSGLEMFVRQAAEQFRLWFPSKTPDVDLMRCVVLEQLSKNRET